MSVFMDLQVKEGTASSFTALIDLRKAVMHFKRDFLLALLTSIAPSLQLFIAFY
jgi:hypothetical protein